MVAACAAAIALSTIAACSESSSKSAAKSVTTPTNATSGTTPSAADQAESAAIAAYTGMWKDMAHASDTANWQDKSLPHHATGEALAEMVSGLYSLNQKGLVSRGAPVLHPRLTSSTSTAADITDCASTTSWLEYVASTGKLKNNTPGGNRLVKAHVELADGVWRVTDYTVGELGSC